MLDTTLVRLGLGERERALFAPLIAGGLEPARIARVDRGFVVAATARGFERAEPAMHLVRDGVHDVDSRLVVGDWVVLERRVGHPLPIVEAILPRNSAIVRRDPAGEAIEQVIVANVDVVFVVQALSGKGVNLARLERELVIAWDSGATPVVVLTKSDLSDDAEAQRERVAEIAFGVDIIVESAVTGLGIDEVRARVPEGVTAVLLGASGVGKSTLVNRLVGDDVRATGPVRVADGKGRHVTVARELIALPDGGVIIDTPGIRAVGLWASRDAVAAAFPDIEALAAECRFRDCTHTDEPGCAVRAAVEAGALPERRLESFRRLTEEVDALARRHGRVAGRPGRSRGTR